MEVRGNDVDCCIAGGGPAGLMAGFLLERAGAKVAVLEKHGDFLRDFRGDTIHPSTLEIFSELGLLEEFLNLPHEKADTASIEFGGETLTLASLKNLPVACPFIAFMPQWDFLNYLALKAAAYPAFRLIRNCEAADLIREGGRVRGVRARGEGGELAIRARLVIAADGRNSLLRGKAGLAAREIGAPMDVLWFSLPRRASDGGGVAGRIDPGRMLIRFSRGSYWQCAYIIPKDGFRALQSAGLGAFRANLAASAPVLADRAGEINGWDQVKLLSVRIDRLERWHQPGFLCIGDAAHAMSPVGGVGVNLAVQDAVAAANLLWKPLRDNTLTDTDLAAVQSRREWPARAVQFMQVQVQNRLVKAALESKAAIRPPLALRIVAGVPYLQRLAGRMIGLGIRREYLTAPEQPGEGFRA